MNVCTYQMCVPGSFTIGQVRVGVWTGRGMMLTTYIYLAPTLRINGAIPLHPLYMFIAWTGTTLYILSVLLSTV